MLSADFLPAFGALAPLKDILTFPLPLKRQS